MMSFLRQLKNITSWVSTTADSSVVLMQKFEAIVDMLQKLQNFNKNSLNNLKKIWL